MTNTTQTTETPKMTDPTMVFEITRRHELYHDGYKVARFATEHAAADIAIRFAQDANALYAISYNVMNPEVA